MDQLTKSRRYLLSMVTLATLTVGPVWAQDGPNAAEKEQQLLAVLRSDAPAADKAITCKHLSVYGSSAAVPDLARLLSDEQLASWARIALEVIPGPAADDALRQALETVQGRLLVGVINSIGVRQDANAVDALTERLKDPDAEVASAAAVALGHIGNDSATKALRDELAVAPTGVSSAVAEGCVLCAERRLAEGRDKEAAEIYDAVRNADVPKPRVLEATRGLILARKSDGIPLLIELLRAPDLELFRLALGTARELPGNQVDQALAAEVARANPDRALLIVIAMADRKETVVLPAILKAAASGALPVRIAAVNALGRVGDASCLPPLLELALDSEPTLAQAAKAALAELPSAGVDKEVVARLAQADGKMYTLLIELVGNRRIDALADLLKALEHSDSAVRTAALTSLGYTVPAQNLRVLVSQFVAPKHAEDAPVAQQALKVACVRMPDREACATELTKAMERSPAATKAALLEMLGAVGGTKALQAMSAAAKSDDPQLQDASTRLLGEWMTIDAAPVLLDLAKTAPGEKYQVRAMRGYIRIARQFVMPDAQRAEMCAQALKTSQNTAEQKLVLDILKRYPSAEMHKLALQAAQNPELKEEANQVAKLIAEKIGNR